MGCIIRDFDYEPPENLPPSVHSHPMTSMSVVHSIDLDAPVGGDAGPAGETEFLAIVRDPNYTDELTGLIFLDRNPAAGRVGLIDERTIPPVSGTDPLNRQVSFTLDRQDINLAGGPGCHVLELHVSRRFVGQLNPQPEAPADIGIGVWFIEATNDASPVVDMSTCPRPR